MRDGVGPGPAKHTVNPPQKAAHLKALAGRSYRVSQLAHDRDVSSIAFDAGAPIPWATPLITRMPETGVGTFRDASVIGAQGYPVTRDGTLIIDAINVHNKIRSRRYARPVRLGPVHHLPGVTVNLGSLFARGNYGHLVLDCVGRLGLMMEAGLDVSRVDHVLIPPQTFPTVIEVLSRLGLGADKHVQLLADSNLICETLIQTTFPGRPRNYSTGPSTVLRAVPVPEAGPHGRRLMILREGEKRSVANLEAVAALADEFDLELFNPRDSAFAVADFARASMVVGAHGAALSDIAASPPGCTVVELLPSVHRYPYFASLALAGGHSYHALDCSSKSGERNADFEVDVDALRRLLDRWG